MNALARMASQGGVISRDQAREAGLTDASIARLVRKGEWKRLFPTVFRHVAAPISDRMMVEATMLWLGGSAALWGSWAAWWHGFRTEPDGSVSVTVPRHQNGRRHEFVDVRRRDLDPRDIVVVRGVPVTSRALTALENARYRGGQSTFDRALQKRVSVTELARPVERMWHAYGVVAARAAMEIAGDGTVSPPERELSAALRDAGLSVIRAGVRVIARGNQYWIDFAVAELKFAIEIDGHTAHSDPEQFERDRKRQNDLIRDGWIVLRYTRWQIRNELPAIVAEIRATLTSFGVKMVG